MANKTIQLLLSERYSKPFLNAVLDLIEGGISVFANMTVLVMYSGYIVDKNINPGFILTSSDIYHTCFTFIWTTLWDTSTLKPNLLKTLLFLMIMSDTHLIFAIALQRYLMICRPFTNFNDLKLLQNCYLMTIFFSLVIFGMREERRFSIVMWKFD